MADRWNEFVHRFRVRQVFTINLERRRDRRQFMEEELSRVRNSVPHEFLSAVDGGELDITELKKRANVKLRAPYVVATNLSWQMAIQRALEVDSFPTLITEDDIKLSEMNENVALDALHIPAQASIISFANGQRIKTEHRGILPIIDMHTEHRKRISSAGMMYFPTREGAECVLNTMAFSNCYIHADRQMLLKSTDAYVCYPPLFKWITSQSNILGGIRKARRFF